LETLIFFSRIQVKNELKHNRPSSYGGRGGMEGGRERERERGRKGGRDFGMW
jgi:hypothetical protein